MFEVLWINSVLCNAVGDLDQGCCPLNKLHSAIHRPEALNRHQKYLVHSDGHKDSRILQQSYFSGLNQDIKGSKYQNNYICNLLDWLNFLKNQETVRYKKDYLEKMKVEVLNLYNIKVLNCVRNPQNTSISRVNPGVSESRTSLTGSKGIILGVDSLNDPDQQIKFKQVDNTKLNVSKESLNASTGSSVEHRKKLYSKIYCKRTIITVDTATETNFPITGFSTMEIITTLEPLEKILSIQSPSTSYATLSITGCMVTESCVNSSKPHNLNNYIKASTFLMTYTTSFITTPIIKVAKTAFASGFRNSKRSREHHMEANRDMKAKKAPIDSSDYGKGNFEVSPHPDFDQINRKFSDLEKKLVHLSQLYNSSEHRPKGDSETYNNSDKIPDKSDSSRNNSYGQQNLKTNAQESCLNSIFNPSGFNQPDTLKSSDRQTCTFNSDIKAELDKDNQHEENLVNFRKPPMSHDILLCDHIYETHNPYLSSSTAPLEVLATHVDCVSFGGDDVTLTKTVFNYKTVTKHLKMPESSEIPAKTKG